VVQASPDWMEERHQRMSLTEYGTGFPCSVPSYTRIFDGGKRLAVNATMIRTPVPRRAGMPALQRPIISSLERGHSCPPRSSVILIDSDNIILDRLSAFDNHSNIFERSF
jgi:hypothetical protein